MESTFGKRKCYNEGCGFDVLDMVVVFSLCGECVERLKKKPTPEVWPRPQPWLSLGVPGKCALRHGLRYTELGSLLSL